MFEKGSGDFQQFFISAKNIIQVIKFSFFLFENVTDEGFENGSFIKIDRMMLKKEMNIRARNHIFRICKQM